MKRSIIKELANVCCILFNLDSADFTGPLTSFQAPKFDKKDFNKLLTTINNTGGESKLESPVLNDVFEMWWPKLEAKIKAILDAHVNHEENNLRSEREILEEVLVLTRMNAKRLPRCGEVSKETVQRLLDIVHEMQCRMLKITNGKESMINFEELRVIIKRLSMEMDSPDLYDRFMLRNEKFFDLRMLFTENDKKE